MKANSSFLRNEYIDFGSLVDVNWVDSNAKDIFIPNTVTSIKGYLNMASNITVYNTKAVFD